MVPLSPWTGAYSLAGRKHEKGGGKEGTTSVGKLRLSGMTG